jgi:hypothetical protein
MKSFTKLVFTTLLLFYIQSFSQQDPNVNQIINSVSLDRLSQTVKELSGAQSTLINGTLTTISSRYAYEPGNISAADYIEQKLISYGYSISNQISGTTRNIYAQLPGIIEPGEKYIICAHYDSYISGSNKTVSPGADDNASGTAAVLEAARILKSYYPKNTIVFVLFDEEELGLYGSKLYANLLAANTLGVINLDMLGYDSDNDYTIDLHVRNVSNSLALAAALNDINRVYSIGVNLHTVNPGTTDSDQASFWNKSYGAIGLIEADQDFSTYYHKTTDQFSKMNTEYFLRNAKLGIATIAYLALPTNDGSSYVAGGIEIPESFSLKQNYPNPFNPQTVINYQLPIAGFVSLKVFDLLGREVAALVNEFQQAGNYSSQFSAHNLSGGIQNFKLSTGIYFYTLRTNNYSETKKMILMK